MIFRDQEEFLKESRDTLKDIVDILLKAPSIKLEELEPQKTAIIIVDMINGFAREGVLKSPRVEKIASGISRLCKAGKELKIPSIAFADCHTDVSQEFADYPPHCIEGTTECEVVDEIKEVGGYTLIPKNSTNGFLEDEFRKWLEQNCNIDTFVITGDCTDICVMQFATTLKTWFNMQDIKGRVIVPIDAVDTYDLSMHNGDLMNVMALYMMMINGIEIVKSIEV